MATKQKRNVRKNQRPKSRKLARPVKWAIIAVGAALVVFAIARLPGVAYTDRDLGMIDFSFLNSAQKKTALEAANRTRCTCGCGMSVAQCVATDPTCPFRDQHITDIRRMVSDAASAQGD